LHGPTVAVCRERTDDADLDEMCYLFKQLLERLLVDVDEPLRVVCVIDSLDSFVTSATSKHDVARLLQCLKDLSTSTDGRFALKLIVTTRFTAIGIGYHFSLVETIDLGDARKIGPIPGLVTRLGWKRYNIALSE